MGLKRFFILSLLLGVGCGVITKTPQKSSFTPEDAGYTGALKTSFLYTEGIKASLLYGDRERAEKLFQSAIEGDSTHAPSYFEAAATIMQTDPAKALSYSQKANILDSTNIWYKTQLGRLMIMTQNYDKAFSIYEKLVEQSPTNSDNYRLLAALYQQDKQPFTAIAVLDSAEYKVGRVEELADFKRQLLIDVKLYDKAINETIKLIDEFPYKEENYLILAELYAATRKDSLAVAAYDRAVEINPTNPDVLLSINEYYKNNGDNIRFLATLKPLFQSDGFPLSSKISFFESLVRDKQFYSTYFFQMSELASMLIVKYPNDHKALELYAGHLIASGSIDQALELYKSRTSDSTPNIEIFNNILDIEAYKQNVDSVAKYADLAIQFFPSNTELYIRKGAALAYLKRDKDALASYKEVLKRSSSDSLKSVVYGIMGDMAYQKNANDKYFSYYDKALKLDTNNVSVLNNYSYFLSTGATTVKKLEKSLVMAEKATRLSPNNPTFLDSYAWVLYKLGRYAEAKKVMQQAISLDRSNNSELFIHYGDILYELKDNFMASVYWKKALEAGHDAAEISARFEKIKGK